jgi:hypothetical protein
LYVGGIAKFKVRSLLRKAFPGLEPPDSRGYERGPEGPLFHGKKASSKKGFHRKKGFHGKEGFHGKRGARQARISRQGGSTPKGFTPRIGFHRKERVGAASSFRSFEAYR